MDEEVKVKSKLSEKKKEIIIAAVLVVILSIMIGVIIILNNNNKKNVEDETTTTTTTTAVNINKLFKGYTEVDITGVTTYNVESKYEIKYADNKKDTIAIYIDNKLFEYEISIESGKLVFKEMESINNDTSFKYSGKNAYAKITNDVKSFIIIHSASVDCYEICVLDSSNNIYYVSSEDVNSITDVINGLKKKTVKNTPSKIGYYTLNNMPYVTAPSGILVYYTSKGEVRNVSDSQLFFNADTYYEYIGLDYSGQIIYVMNDGKMYYSEGENNDKPLYNGDSNVIYKGSFYINEDEDLDMYIIGTDGYLYCIKKMSDSSSVTLTKVNNNKIKKIGYQIITSTTDVATDLKRVVVLFEDDEYIKLDNIKAFEIIQ